MTRTRLSRAERRERILDAARAEFANHGYGAASVRAIAASAGVTTPVVYDHFSSKQDLYVDLLEVESQALTEATAELRVDDPSRPEAWIAAGVEAFFAFAEQRPHAWRMLFHDVPADSEIAEAHRALQRDGDAAIARLLANLPVTDDALTEADLQRLAVAARSTVNGLAQWWWEHPETTRGAVVDTAVRLLTHGLLDR